MLKLDHLTIIAPSLKVGSDYVRERLGIDMPTGGKHPEMGTHNLLLRLSNEVFLEVIAVDPDAAPPGRPRWFGLDHGATIQSAWDDGFCLRGWVAQTEDLDRVLARHGDLLGQKTHVSRGERSWLFAVRSDGSLPDDGVAPSVISWGEQGSPAPAMRDLGAKLVSFHIEHPEPARVRDLYARLGVRNGPQVQHGPRFRYCAFIETPCGMRELY